MIIMVLLFVLFLAGGLTWMIRIPSNKTEKALFIGITALGATLWGSILLRHPLDLNKAIAWILSG